MKAATLAVVFSVMVVLGMLQQSVGMYTTTPSVIDNNVKYESINA